MAGILQSQLQTYHKKQKAVYCFYFQKIPLKSLFYSSKSLVLLVQLICIFKKTERK